MSRRPRANDTLTEAQKKIVEAAVSAFAEQGFAGTATKDIARRAGVAEATIFKYFPSKRELLLGVLGPAIEQLVGPAMARSMDPVLSATYPSFEAFLRALLAERIAFVRAHPRLVRILAQELPFDAELRMGILRRVYAPLLAKGLALIERFQQEGQVVDWPAPLVVRCVVSTFMGYIVHRVFIAPDAAWDDQAEVDRIITFLVRGLSPGQPA
ncbi:TetR family transcriptional regulator [Sorangium cellulosum]|uniref:TetR family transcriptional regulator n=1 Tax=Sorangium cellulosum TaxID=56 RepID=A0A2L0EHE2_SORCE|nr:TetR/AcrR family transcriptional regulator [Sorangium cellulosum]AUX38710.1 TetR family transcriptional regulator [Sorangium cellulosum]